MTPQKSTTLPWSPWGEELQKTGYLKLPHPVFRLMARQGLTHSESAIAITMVSLMRPDARYVEVTKEQLAVWTGCCLNTVIRCLKKLRDLGVEQVMGATARNGLMASYDMRPFLARLEEGLEDVVRP